MPALEDYLTKQIYIDKDVVTFRSLSRQFQLHVNNAKNELAKFHTNSTNSGTRSYATYLLSGELFPKTSAPTNTDPKAEDGMEVDSEACGTEDVEDEEDVPLTTMTLVGESDLEHAKSRYARIFSCHVYCLSPSPLTDAGLICDPSTIVYKADAKDTSTSSIVLGRIVGPDVRIGKVAAPVASSSKVSEPVSRKPGLKAKVEEPSSKVKEEKEKVAAVKPKASGKLDWSKAKRSSEEKGAKSAAKEVVPPPPALKVKKESTPVATRDASPQDDSKRGLKRKAAPPPASDSEEESQKSASVPVKTEVKLRKNRVVSDDEDEDEPVRSKAKSKSRASILQAKLEHEEEASLRAMMDLDDAQVEKASTSRRPDKAIPKEIDEEDVVMASEPEPELKSEPDADEDMMFDDTPKAKPRKKKEKKVVPVGRNGLKKKRVMKSRMTVDSKGYMVTEDYSEYESVDEEEPEEESQKKPAKAKKAATAKPKKEPDEDAPPPTKSKPPARASSIKTKGSGAKPSATQGSLKDFFGKPKK